MSGNTHESDKQRDILESAPHRFQAPYIIDRKVEQTVGCIFTADAQAVVKRYGEIGRRCGVWL
jgi:hypothetical protein